jgi:hypothetical protein
MKYRLAFLLGAATAPWLPAHGDFFKVDLQFSVDGGSTWADNVETAGSSVRARFVLSAERVAGMVSIAGVEIPFISLTEARSGDSISDIVLPPPFTSSNWFFSVQGNQIDRTVDPVHNNVRIAQQPLESPVGSGVADNPWDGVYFTYNLENAGERTVGFSANASKFVAPSVYTTPGGSNAAIRTNLSFDGGAIHVTPAPGVGSALSVGGLVIMRRRHRGRYTRPIAMC